VTIGPIDWQSLGAALGVTARQASTEAELGACLRETAAAPGPVLIAARVNALAYEDTIRALRG
jgi:thiamine pyrophosphate-dependent acetolactate synthase large subunit-like protein